MNAWVNCKIFGFAADDAAHTQHGNQHGAEWIAGKKILGKTRGRLIVVLVFFVLAYGGVVARMTHLTLTRTNANDMRIAAAPPKIGDAQRADIMDRNGLLLATSLKASSLYADPTRVLDPVDAARQLNATFPDLAYNDLLKKLQSRARFVWLKRNLTPKQLYAANALGLPGIEFITETRRIYPQGAATAHVLGYTDIDHKGLAGLERGLNEALRQPDKPLQTSLDMRLQHILRREIATAITDFDAIGGAGIIMDVNNGEVQAMASLPDFNPHNPGDITDVQRFNRITLGAYEMGSTFKTFTTAALLDTLHLPLRTTYETRYPLQRAGFKIHDFHPEPNPLNVAEIYMHSSNVGTALEAEQLGTTRLRGFFAKAGLLEKTPFEIQEQAAPMIPKPWLPISTLTAAYGHGIAVTPLQLATAYASIINGGYKIKPTLVKHDPSVYANMTRERLISAETSSIMRGLMRIVVTNGTATKANIAGYRVGGKTGTAEKTLGHGYSKHAQIASFVGVFPMDAPRYVVLVMVDEPKGNKKSFGYATAGWVAAPAVGRIIRDMAPIVGVTPQHDDRLAGWKASLGLSSTTDNTDTTIVSTRQQGGRFASY